MAHREGTKEDNETNMSYNNIVICIVEISSRINTHALICASNTRLIYFMKTKYMEGWGPKSEDKLK